MKPHMIGHTLCKMYENKTISSRLKTEPNQKKNCEQNKQNSGAEE